jgi:hypothetical protein
MAKKDQQTSVAEVPQQGVQEAKVEVPAVQESANGSKELSSNLDDMFLADAGSGLQNMGAGDFAIPFIAILQKGSPQVSRANSKYLGKDAVAGNFMNTVTNEIYDGSQGIGVVPCGYSKEIVRWRARDSGGGLVSRHHENDPMFKKMEKDDRGRYVLPDSTDIFVDTAYHFVLLLHGEEVPPEMAVIAMASTQLKKSRVWNTAMRRVMMKGPNGYFNPPSYSHEYLITTVGETRDSYDWFGFNIVSIGRVSDPGLYKMAREFAKQVDVGGVRVSAPPVEFDEETGAGRSASAGSSEVPF